MLNQAQIEKKAAEVLETAGIHRAPVDVERIASKLGAQIEFEKADDEISGALFRLAIPVIGVNSTHPLNRQRFTIAHEIAHLVLHNDSAHTDYRNVVSSQATDPKEIEANKFAAAILMPEYLIRKSVAKRTKPLDESAIRRLSVVYRVSAQAMALRLTNLGIAVDMSS